MKKSQSTILVAVLSGFAKVIAKLRVWAERYIPLGYEDESGFHVGVEQ